MIGYDSPDAHDKHEAVVVEMLIGGTESAVRLAAMNLHAHATNFAALEILRPEAAAKLTELADQLEASADMLAALKTERNW